MRRLSLAVRNKFKGRQRVLRRIFINRWNWLKFYKLSFMFSFYTSKLYFMLYNITHICYFYTKIFSSFFSFLCIHYEMNYVFFNGDFFYFFKRFLSYIVNLINIVFTLLVNTKFKDLRTRNIVKLARDDSVVSRKYNALIFVRLLKSCFILNLTSFKFFRFNEPDHINSSLYCFRLFRLVFSVFNFNLRHLLPFNLKCLKFTGFNQLKKKFLALVTFMNYSIWLSETSNFISKTKIRSLVVFKAKFLYLMLFLRNLTNEEFFSVIVFIQTSGFLFGFCFILTVRKGKLNLIRETNYKLWFFLNYLVSQIFLTFCSVFLLSGLLSPSIFTNSLGLDAIDSTYNILRLHNDKTLFFNLHTSSHLFRLKLRKLDQKLLFDPVFQKRLDDKILEEERTSATEWADLEKEYLARKREEAKLERAIWLDTKWTIKYWAGRARIRPKVSKKKRIGTRMFKYPMFF